MKRLKFCIKLYKLSILHSVHIKSFTTVKPVLSDRIKQNICLAFQAGGCLLLHESSAVSAPLSFNNKQTPVYSNFHVT